MMKFKSRKPKPETGLDLSVTFSLSAGLNAEENGAAIVAFLSGIRRLSDDIKAVWVHLNAEIPDEFREQVQTALDQARNPAGLKVIVNIDTNADR